MVLFSKAVLSEKTDMVFILTLELLRMQEFGKSTGEKQEMSLILTITLKVFK